MVVGQKLAHDGKHHQGRGQIIQIRRQQISNQGNHPQQAAAAARHDPFADEIKAAVCVQQVHDSHRGQQIEHYLANIRHMGDEHMVRNEVFQGSDGRRIPVQELGILRRMPHLHKIMPAHHVEQPSDHTEKHGHGRLVDIGDMLRGNRAIAQQQNGNNDKRHGDL